MPTASTKSTSRPMVANPAPSRKRKNASKTEATDPIVPPDAAPPDAAPPDAAPPDAAPPKKKRNTNRKPKKVDEDADTTISSVAPSVVSSVASSAVGKKGRKTRRGKLSSRTPSSYVLFSMEERKTITQNNPDLGLGEISKMCGIAWKKLTDEEKAPWNAKAQVLKDERLKAIQEIQQNEPPKKKRSPSSYLLFAMDYRKEVLKSQPGLAIGEISKLCGSKWKEMPDAEKQKWKDQAIAMKESVA